MRKVWRLGPWYAASPGWCGVIFCLDSHTKTPNPAKIKAMPTSADRFRLSPRQTTPSTTENKGTKRLTEELRTAPMYCTLE
jgi:hypothetical protein